jgi:iron complex transport system ATP-binding protein
MRDVCFAYERTPVLRGVSFDLAASEIVAVIGPNGAGKTTLLKIAAGLLSASSGEVTRASSRGGVAYLSQGDGLPGAFTAREIVALGRVPHTGFVRAASRKDHDAVDAALARTNTLALAERLVGTLSGGEQQRVALARALAQEPAVLLLDEPTNHLDPRHQVELFAALRAAASEGVGVVAVVHDLGLAGAADRCVLLAAGTLVADGPPEEVLDAERLGATYGTTMHVVRAPDGRTVAVPAMPAMSAPRAKGRAGA